MCMASGHRKSDLYMCSISRRCRLYLIRMEEKKSKTGKPIVLNCVRIEPHWNSEILNYNCQNDRYYLYCISYYNCQRYNLGMTFGGSVWSTRSLNNCLYYIRWYLCQNLKWKLFPDVLLLLGKLFRSDIIVCIPEGCYCKNICTIRYCRCYTTWIMQS